MCLKLICNKNDQIIFSNATCPDVFSRVCRGCHIEEPRERFASVKCGHVVCRKCADGSNECPLCEEPTTFIRLFEDEEEPRCCRICYMQSPIHISVYSCGHTLCPACFYQILIDKIEKRGDGCCPFCKVYPTYTFDLQEELIPYAEQPDNHVIESTLPYPGGRLRRFTRFVSIKVCKLLR